MVEHKRPALLAGLCRMMISVGVCSPTILLGKNDETRISRRRLTGEFKPKPRARAPSPVLAEFGSRRNKSRNRSMCQVGDRVVTRRRKSRQLYVAQPECSRSKKCSSRSPVKHLAGREGCFCDKTVTKKPLAPLKGSRAVSGPSDCRVSYQNSNSREPSKC